MAALHKLAPQFIKEGRLCWLRSPLYIVKNGKTETYYFTDEEIERAGKIKGEVQRNKGLGSLSAEQARLSMFDSRFQRLEVLCTSSAAEELLERLMGDEPAERRDFIFKNVDFSTIKE